MQFPSITTLPTAFSQMLDILPDAIPKCCHLVGRLMVPTSLQQQSIVCSPTTTHRLHFSIVFHQRPLISLRLSSSCFQEPVVSLPLFRQSVDLRQCPSTHLGDLHPLRQLQRCYRMRNEKRLMFFKAMPVPRAIARSGSSAIWNGRPVFSDKRRSSPLIRAPPPAK